MIRFSCPTCKTVFTAQDGQAGEKFACTKCDQRIQVPKPPPGTTVLGELLPEPNKTVLGLQKPLPPAGAAAVATAPFAAVPMAPVAAIPVQDLPILDVIPVDPPAPHRRRPHCPYCGSDERPYPREEIAPAGWAVFAVLVFFFFPLCFLGLLIKETYYVCADCGAKLPR